jgi:hypothetical protein
MWRCRCWVRIFTSARRSSTNRQVAAAFGVALAATVLSSQTNGARVLDVAAQVQAGLTGFHLAIASILVLGLFSVVFALRIRDQDQAPSRAPVVVRERLAAAAAGDD